MDQIISPAKYLSGCIRLPGDKSISHRALMMAAIAEGTTEIENLSTGKDVQSTANCLRQLGVKVKQKAGVVQVVGRGLDGLVKPDATLDVGNSGTTMRLLAGILAGHAFTSTIRGDASIQRRPMSRIVKPLRQMGADVQAVKGEFAPLRITGGNLRAISYRMPVASAQLKSCILFAGLYADGTTEVIEPSLTRDHTERMLQTFGAQLNKDGLKSSVSARPQLRAQKIFVPGDLSSAAFFIAAGILGAESELLIENVGINPTRKAFLTILCDLGARIEIINVASMNNELVADILVQSSKLKGLRIPPEKVPQVIDELPVLAVLATQAEGSTEIRGAGELRFKESDRLRAVSRNLHKMGAEVEELEDGWIVHGPVQLQGAELDSYHDHRIAMAFTVAALTARGPSKIRHADCAQISFPEFYDLLQRVRND
ncbi:MAG: 3-phosphoshikimate 1-carboxyvinyltransferase [bacterium]